MKLISKASSSSGNSHILVGDNEAIMLDCGVKNISYATGLNLVGVLLTHSHHDHIAGLMAKNYLGCVNIYGNKETLDSINVPFFVKKEIEPQKAFRVGKEFIVSAFIVPHDKECYAYIIHHQPSGRRILYITDTGSLDNYVARSIDTFIIECNYDSDYYDKLNEQAGIRELTGHESALLSKYKRLSSGNGHLSIKQCAQFLKYNIDSATRNVVLVHISKNNDPVKVRNKLARKLPRKRKINVVAIDNNIPPSKVIITEL